MISPPGPPSPAAGTASPGLAARLKALPAADVKLVGAFLLLLAAGYFANLLWELPITAGIFHDALGIWAAVLVLPLAAGGWWLWRALGRAGVPATWRALLTFLAVVPVAPALLRAGLVGEMGYPSAPPLRVLPGLAAAAAAVLLLALVAERRPRLAVGLLAGSFIVVATALAWFRLYRGCSADTGMFAMSFWNTLQGRFMVNTLEGGGAQGVNHLAVHFSPILLPLIPVYALWRSSYSLLLVQCAVVGLAALPCFQLLSREYPGRPALLDRRSAFIITGLLLLSPAILCPTVDQFHETLFAPAAFLWAAHCFRGRRPVAFALSCLLLLSIKEIYGLIVALFGLLALLERRRSAWVVLPLAIGLAWTGASLSFVIGRQTKDQPEYFRYLYQHLGPTLPAKLHTIFCHPGAVYHHLSRAANRAYLSELLAPLGFAPPFTNVWGLFALPHMLLNMLTRAEQDYTVSLNYWHSALVAAVLVLAFGTALGRWRARWQASPRAAAWVAALALLAICWYGAKWVAVVAKATPSAREAAQARAVLARIPPQASVLAPLDLSPWLAHRRELYWLQHLLPHAPDFIWRRRHNFGISGNYRLVIAAGPHELWQRVNPPAPPPR